MGNAKPYVTLTVLAVIVFAGCWGVWDAVHDLRGLGEFDIAPAVHMLEQTFETYAAIMDLVGQPDEMISTTQPAAQDAAERSE